MRRTSLSIAALTAALSVSTSAFAQGYDGNFMVRILGAQVISQDQLNSLTSVTAAPTLDLKAAGFDAEISDRFIPAATLTYFLTKNLSLELFCCFTKHHVDLKAPPAFAFLSGKVADSWMFPPAVTMQYHFDGLGAFKPYVGGGLQWIHFFNEGTGSNTLRSSRVTIDDAFGWTVQAGIDVAIGNGWYLNADVKKTWLDTTATWHNSAITGGNIVAKVDVDPLIVSAGIGYRFNLGDLGGRSSAPLK